MKKSLIFGVMMIVLTTVAADVNAQWAPPTQSPPNGNVSSPINTSGTAQSKIGGLLLNTGGATNGLIVQLGTSGFGTASPNSAYRVDVSGLLNATQLCIAGTCRSSWPAAGGSGTVTSVGTTNGILGGTITTSGTLSADTNYLQRRVSGTCSSGSAIRIVNSDGTVTCQSTSGGVGTVTSLSAGTGVTLSPNPITTTGTISVNTASIQNRVTGTCSSGSSIRIIDSNGNVTCETDDSGGSGTVTSISTGSGISGGTITTSGTLTADVNYLQRRVSSSCSSGSSIRVINWDGSVSCETDDSGSGSVPNLQQVTAAGASTPYTPDFNGGINMGSGTTLRNNGRLHVYSGEILYLLPQSGVTIGREWGGNGNLNVQGSVSTGTICLNGDCRSSWPSSGGGSTYQQGMWCGRGVTGGGGGYEYSNGPSVNCQGYDPSWGCPGGFTRSNFSVNTRTGAPTEWYYTCIKN